MSEKKYLKLESKMKLNVTVSKEERQLYDEQRVLRKLARFEKLIA